MITVLNPNLSNYGIGKLIIGKIGVLEIKRYDSSTSTSGRFFTNLTSIFNYVIMGVPTMIYFSIVILFFINKTLFKEINNGQFTIWATSPVSRTQILLSKFSFIILSNALIFAPTFIISLVCSGFALDANENFKYVLLNGFLFFIFLCFLTSLYFFLAIILVNKPVIVNLILSILLFYITTTWILTLMKDLLYWTNFAKESWFIKYISIQSLFANILITDNSNLMIWGYFDKYLDAQGKYVYDYLQVNLLSIKKIDSLYESLMNIIVVISSVILFSLGCLVFSRKNLNI
ncbi:hypothetical protein [Spiroplasma endosymbiont of Labia minor]|uniref:hypothetical protein n=1 Tax=Spiroplasma endosymbiont of Labia minor TaxID=3066305 RepID=UPI0030D40007